MLYSLNVKKNLMCIYFCLNLHNVLSDRYLQECITAVNLNLYFNQELDFFLTKAFKVVTTTKLI